MSQDDLEMSPPSSAAAPSKVYQDPTLGAWQHTWASVVKFGRIFWICNGIFLLDGAAYFGILGILTLFLGQELGLPDTQVGPMVSAFTAMATLTSALLGTITDRLGIRRTITVSLLLALVGRSLIAVSPSLPIPLLWVALSMILMATSAGMLTPAVYAGVKEDTDEDNSALGFSLVYALMNGGIVLESIASSYVREHFGPSGVFVMCAGITLTALLTHLVLYPATSSKKITDKNTKAEQEKQQRHGTNEADTALKNRKHPLADMRFLFFISILLGVRTLFAHQWLTMPDYVIRAYPEQVGARFEWINGLNPFIILIGTPFVAVVTKNLHVVTMMIIGTSVSALSTLLLVPGPDTTMLLLYVIVFSIGEALWSSKFMEYVAEIAPKDQVGSYMGIAQVPWFVAKFTTGLYSGYMLQKYCPPVGGGQQDTTTMWLVYLCIALTTPIGLIVARKWLTSDALLAKKEAL